MGSIHVDIQIEVAHLPEPGETVIGARHRQHPGGKGANQAVATALSGHQVTLIGRVGDDQDGRFVNSALADRGVDIAGVRVDPEAPTGLAFIVVDDNGANQIVVSPGASGRLRAIDVRRRGDVIASADVLLVQLEVPIEAVEAAVELAGEGTTVVLNPAPVRHLAPALLERVDVLVPNLLELTQLSGKPNLASLGDIEQAARRLSRRTAVVVTLGADGALLVEGSEAQHVRGEPVAVIDTTGAGDAFCGALAGALAVGNSLETSVKAANRFAAASTTRRGAFSSYNSM